MKIKNQPVIILAILTLMTVFTFSCNEEGGGKGSSNQDTLKGASTVNPGGEIKPADTVKPIKKSQGATETDSNGSSVPDTLKNGPSKKSSIPSRSPQ